MIRISLLILAVIFFASCTENNDSGDGQVQNVVASVDDLTVSKDHFLASFKRYYYKSGQSLKPNYRNRKAIVESELKPYMLTVHARDKGWADDEAARRKKEMIQRKVYSEEYLENFVLDTVQVSESDLRFQFYKFNTKVRASHLFARSRSEIDSIYEQLKNGKDFNQLAKETFQSDYLANNGGDVGAFSVDEMDVAFENAAYRMDKGEVSEPVKTNQGYSIVKVTEKYPKPIMTETEFQKRKPQLRTFAIRQQEELATRKHLKETTEWLNPEERSIQKLWEDIERQHSDFVGFGDSGQETLLNISLDDDTPLTENEEFTYTVADFKEDLYYTPRKARERIGKSHQFADFVKGLAYQKYAVNRFRSSRFASDESIKQSINETFYNYLSNRVSDSLRDDITIPLDDMREEFEKNYRIYANDVQLDLAKIEFEERETAEKALKEINDGLPFKKALQKYTTQGSDLLSDGRMGYVSVNQMGKFSEDFKDTKPGDLVGPLEYHSGRFMLFKCRGRRVKEKSFEEAKPEIYRNMISGYVKQRKEELIADIKKEHKYQFDEKKLRNIEISLNN